MADVAQCVMAALRAEDSTLSGVITDTPGDAGGKTRFGLASKFHPELLRTTFYSTMPTADALQVAVNVLTEQYAAPLQLAAIADATVARILMVFAVNAGVERAVKKMQLAVDALHPGAAPLPLDGVMGPKTLAAIAGCYAVSLAMSFRLQVIEFYYWIVTQDPSQREFFEGWVKRGLQC